MPAVTGRRLTLECRVSCGPSYLLLPVLGKGDGGEPRSPEATRWHSEVLRPVNRRIWYRCCWLPGRVLEQLLLLPSPSAAYVWWARGYYGVHFISTFVPILSQINSPHALAILFLEDTLSCSLLPLVRPVGPFISGVPIKTLYTCRHRQHHHHHHHKLFGTRLNAIFSFNLLSLSNWNSRKFISHAEFYALLAPRLSNLTNFIPSSFRVAFGLFVAALCRNLASSQTAHNSTDGALQLHMTVHNIQPYLWMTHRVLLSLFNDVTVCVGLYIVALCWNVGHLARLGSRAGNNREICWPLEVLELSRSVFQMEPQASVKSFPQNVSSAV